MQDCVFCDITERGSNLLTNTILYEDSDFYIVPALGCLVPGYVLIVSKEHINSMCYLSEQKRERLKTLIYNLSERYFFKYGFYPLIFEHGAKNDCMNLSGCCVLHAHIHIVPHLFDSFEKMNTKLELSQVVSINDFFEKCTDKSYLFFMNNIRNIFISKYEDNVAPSQTFRKWIAADIGIPYEWDWRVNHFDKNILNTVVHIGFLLESVRLSENNANIQNIYYCRAMDGLEKNEVKSEYLMIKERLKENEMKLINMYADNHNLLEINKKNSMMILHENTNGIDSADCVIVNLSIENHLYVGCIDEMIQSKLKGRFVIVVVGNAGADKNFYTHLRSHLIVKTIDEAIDYLVTNRNSPKIDSLV